jgi:hypothetical protein
MRDVGFNVCILGEASRPSPFFYRKENAKFPSDWQKFLVPEAAMEARDDLVFDALTRELAASAAR